MARKPPPISIHEVIYRYAEAVNAAADMLEPQFSEDLPEIASGSDFTVYEKAGTHVSESAKKTPYLSLDCFAAELYVKALYAMEHSGPPPRGHAVKWYYMRLKPKTKGRIRNNFSAEVSKRSKAMATMPSGDRALYSSLIKLLNASKGAYMDVRYLYERIWEKKKDMACSDLIRRAVRQTVLGIRLERGFR